MQALGFIETRGLIVAIESADAMLKAAEVTLIEKTNVGGGLVSITVTGDVASVKAAVEAGAAAVSQLKSDSLVSQHVIPRPHEELNSLIGLNKPIENDQTEIFESVEGKPIEETVSQEVEQEKEAVVEDLIIEEIKKSTLDAIVLEHGLQEALKYLSMQAVTALRKLAREYKKLGLAGRSISKANKGLLLSEFKKYYNNESKITKEID